jgi:uncharacterized membrane protein YfcA
MSVLGFTSPAVSATNLLYNVVAIPGGVSQYIREKRMAWPIAWTTLVGTLPGIFIGAILRVRYFSGGRQAKFFVGLVLLWLGYRLLHEFATGSRYSSEAKRAVEAKFRGRLPKDAVVETKHVSFRRTEYEFWGHSFSFSPGALFALSLAVGVAGGIYGIGGGAIIAPFVVSVLHLPVYTIAGAALFGTFVTSIAGVGFFEFLHWAKISADVPVRPDWLLGTLFGMGGLAGTFVGARLQKYLPERLIRLLLGLLVTGLALSYILQFFL